MFTIELTNIIKRLNEFAKYKSLILKYEDNEALMDRLSYTIVFIEDSATKRKVLELMLRLCFQNGRLYDQIETFLVASSPIAESLRTIDINGRTVNVLNMQISLAYIVTGTLLVTASAYCLYKIYSSSYETDQLNLNTLDSGTTLGLEPYDFCTDDTELLTVAFVIGTTALVGGLVSLCSY